MQANRFIRDEVPKRWTPSPEAGSLHDDQPTSGIITVSKYLIHGQLRETRVGIRYWPASCLIAMRRSIAAAVGALVGLLGGPLGALVGGMAGGLIGSIGDLVHAGVTDEFVNDVNTAMTVGKFAVVADVSEDWVTPLDTRMEQISGVVFRRTRSEVKRMQHDHDVAAHRAEMEQLKAERAQARSDRLAKIDATIDALRKKLESATGRDRSKMLFRQNQRDARIQALRAKADQLQGEIRGRLEARIAEVRRDYEKKAAAG